MSTSLVAAAVTTATVGVVHVLVGPDHYVPFIALARVRNWSLKRTLVISLACGIAHVASSVAIGLLVAGAGRSALMWAHLESFRGDVAAWLLLGFGAAYTVWGVRRGILMRRAGQAAEPSRGDVTPWVLFLVFVFGPCEPLIPLVVVPAATESWAALGVAAGTFSVVTVATMAAVITLGYLGVERIPDKAVADRWSHALAGVVVTGCAVAMQMGL